MKNHHSNNGLELGNLTTSKPAWPLHVLERSKSERSNKNHKSNERYLKFRKTYG